MKNVMENKDTYMTK